MAPSSPSPDQFSFTVAFEEDVAALLGRSEYRSRSLFKHQSADDEEDSEPNQLISETEISESYLSLELTTIQPLDNVRSLLVLKVTCHPAPNRRFSHATIIWRFLAAPFGTLESPSPNGLPSSSPRMTAKTPKAAMPKVAALAPQHSVGGWTEEQSRIIWGLNVPLQVGFGGSSVGVEPSHQREVQKGVMHAMTIIGTKRDNHTRCVWTIEENKSSERGIPSHFQFAVVLEHQGAFATELDVKAELAGGLWTTPIQAKKNRGAHGLRRTIDVATWKCGEVSWENGEAGWKAFMASITGEVPGVMNQFEQSIVRP